MEGKLKVTYIKSSIGFNKNQAKVLESLGLKKSDLFNFTSWKIH